MRFLHKKLNNGLNIVGEENPDAMSASVGFFVKTGARDENPEINGVSHFLEHMLFKGTHEISALQVNEAFDNTGAKFNAFTSEENTVYYAAVLPEYLNNIVELWCKLLRPALRDEDFQIEKNVIKQEIAMYRDLPEFDVADKCRNLHFGSHPCGQSVLGSEQTIDTMTAEQMKNYFISRYSPDNMTLACAGNFDFNRLCKQVESLTKSWTPSAVSRQTSFFNGTGLSQRYGRDNLNREHICLMSAAPAYQDDLRYAAAMLAIITGDDVGSRLFWELVDTALAESASMHYDMMDGTGIFYSYIRTAPENRTVVMEKIKKVFDGLMTAGVSEKELTAAKNKRLSTITIKNETPMGRLVDLGFDWTYLQSYQPVDMEIQQIKAVTPADIQQVISKYNIAGFTEVSIGPKQ